jgi:glutamyl-tRNA synthetase
MNLITFNTSPTFINLEIDWRSMPSREQTIRIYAAYNALQHGGEANPKSVLGKLMGEVPELRSQAKELIPKINDIVTEVNALGMDGQRKLLEEMAPELLEEKKVEQREAALPDLPNVDGKVVMRFAPGPSGPLHIGHTRAAILNDEYVKRYGGKFILRLEDTNPTKIDKAAYDMIPQDLEYLGVEVHEIVRQSDRFDLYYEHAIKLLQSGDAYICTCKPDNWRDWKDNSRPCPHHNEEPATGLDKWEKMLDGTFAEGEASLVVKTDLMHPNPAVRDFVGMRILDVLHPMTGNKYRVYPLYNFSVAVDDHLMGMTHVLRGKDHLNNTHRQKYIYEHLGWEQPEFIHYGWVSIDETVLKTSTIKEGIANGQYAGWDDPRLGTIRTLKRRGIHPDAIRKYWVDVGIKEVDIKFSWQNLYDPVEYNITGVHGLEGKAPLHPDHLDWGYRITPLDQPIFIALSRSDTQYVQDGIILRLKDLCNVTLAGEGDLAYAGNDITILKQGVKILHWAAPDFGVVTRVMMPDGEIVEGIAEDIIKEEIGSVVQFERFGFVRLDSFDDELVVAYFCQK